ncbi:hypothetical protein L204_103142 [Cryptococcus depauperatus]|nr:hypothetical protein L204_00112 [Cryptococcus depauperatus CBS 7855]
MMEATHSSSGSSLAATLPKIPSATVSNLNVEEKDKKGLMLPPPIPVRASSSGSSSTSIASVEKPKMPGMARLPSLQQLSAHLHYSPPSPLQKTSPFESFSTHTAAPLHVSTNSLVLQDTSTDTGASPIVAPSPSGRLKLPASAMVRSLSAGAVSKVSNLPAVVSLSMAAAGATQIRSSSHMPINSSSVLASDIPDVLGEYGPDELGSSHSPEPPAANVPDGSTSVFPGTGRTRYIQGYKDVPTLDDIRRRVSVSKGGNLQKFELSAERTKGDAGQRELKEKAINNTKNSVSLSAGIRKEEHLLRHTWTLYYDSKTYKPDASAIATKREQSNSILAEWEISLLIVGKFDTVEGFARHLNNIRLPSRAISGSNYHLFKNGIRPMWEDPANALGGKWVILFKSSPGTMDIAWANLTMALVGDILDPEDRVCGIVASARPKIDRLQIWTRNRDDVEGLNQLGRRIVDIMALEGQDEECMSIEFQYNTNDPRPPPKRFFNIPFPSHRPPSTPNRPVLSTFQIPPSMFGGNGGLLASHAAIGAHLNHPLPLPPHSPAIMNGNIGREQVQLGSDGAGAKRALSESSLFVGQADISRQNYHGGREGVTGV